MCRDLLVRRFSLCASAMTLFHSFACIGALATEPDGQQASETPRVDVKVIRDGESHLPAGKCRKMIVGPGVNQPDPFPGYGGFVGWECPVRLRDGTMYASFSAGYWHASPPTPLKLDPSRIDSWKKIGFPSDFSAPRGGRAMISKSIDDGVTWSKPRTLLDTPNDDRHPSIAQLSDGTLVCSLFTYTGWPVESVDPSEVTGMAVVRSFDGGQTWEKTPRRMPLVPFEGGGTDGPPLELPDGSVLLAGYGKNEELARHVIGVFRSTDSGATWQHLSTVVADHDQHEPSMVRLDDGRLVMITRPESAITWSSDNGRTWTPPATFGFRGYAHTLLLLNDGTLLCHYGCYNAGNLRAIFSTDGGQTWVAPAKGHGFLIDRTYGYSRSCLMPDGCAYLAYIGTGGHRLKDAQNNMIWSVRLRVRADYSGIELIPIADN